MKLSVDPGPSLAQSNEYPRCHDDPWTTKRSVRVPPVPETFNRTAPSGVAAGVVPVPVGGATVVEVGLVTGTTGSDVGKVVGAAAPFGEPPVASSTATTATITIAATATVTPTARRGRTAPGRDSATTAPEWGASGSG